MELVNMQCTRNIFGINFENINNLPQILELLKENFPHNIPTNSVFLSYGNLTFSIRKTALTTNE